MNSPATTPARLFLKKDERLEIDWADGVQSVYPVGLLRGKCPCAACRTQRQDQAKNKLKLTILPGNHDAPLAISGAEKVGNYALQFSFNDGHSSGIYSFDYLREIAPA